MSRTNKKPVDVILPERLVRFWQDVVSLIDVRDSSTIYESDDLLQCDYAYGGLADPGNHCFGFTYFPQDGDIDKQWEFYLSESELRRISSGGQKSVQLFRCQDPRCPKLHSTPDAYCPHCDNVLDSVNGFGNLQRIYPQLHDSTIESMIALTRIARGLVQLSNDIDEWPRHAIYNSRGHAILSWRVKLLPYIDHADLYKDVAIHEPWDSTSNRRLWNEMPSVFRTQPDLGSATTHVTAVIGENTMWPLHVKRHWNDVTTGTSYTVAVLEMGDWSTNWMRPLDVTLSDLLQASRQGTLALHPNNVIVAGMVDGHTEPLSGTNVDALSELLLIW